MSRNSQLSQKSHQSQKCGNSKRGSSFSKSKSGKRHNSTETNPELCRETRTIETDKESSTFSRGRMRNFTAKDITLEVFNTIQPELKGSSRFEPKAYKPVKQSTYRDRNTPNSNQRNSIGTMSVNSRVSLNKPPVIKQKINRRKKAKSSTFGSEFGK